MVGKERGWDALSPNTLREANSQAESQNLVACQGTAAPTVAFSAAGAASLQRWGWQSDAEGCWGYWRDAEGYWRDAGGMLRDTGGMPRDAEGYWRDAGGC